VPGASRPAGIFYSGELLQYVGQKRPPGGDLGLRSLLPGILLFLPGLAGGLAIGQGEFSPICYEIFLVMPRSSGLARCLLVMRQHWGVVPSCFSDVHSGNEGGEYRWWNHGKDFCSRVA
jgi:hypothetical protein